MLKIESTVTPSFEQWSAIIDGTRNPMNSWAMMDSYNSCFDCEKKGTEECPCEKEDQMVLGTSDLNLLVRLASAGNVNASHSKYRRMIPVYVTVTAPLYWWKEFDTYKVGTVRNSCSTMHKITEKEFTIKDFSCEHLKDYSIINGCRKTICKEFFNSLVNTISHLNLARRLYLNTENPEKKKEYWRQIIQLLPSSYNQKSTLFLNYEVLHKIYVDRKGHKLDEWHTFCDWIKDLPYSELIIGEDND